MTTQMQKIVVLVLVAFSMTACQKNNSGSAPIEARGGVSRAGHYSDPAQVGLQLNGVVFSEARYQEDFNHSVRDFLGASIPKEYIGYVSARAENNTGVFIGGQVDLANGQGLRSIVGSRMEITPSSRLVVAVYDYWPNQSGVEPIPPVYFTSSSGYVSGNSAELMFRDSYGYVKLSGQFNDQVFAGTISYYNERNHDGSRQSQPRVLGNFELPTCQFFRCY